MTTDLQHLETIIELSHEFGTGDYVKGGGGNTSFKDASTMWIKPSGTTLGGLTPETMVAMNRAKIDELYAVSAPAESSAREELVKNMMADSVENAAGRPSVEAPLHNVFKATYVVHTHAVLVNGLTCAQGGEAACQKLFPGALWVEYIDPGYTLCMEVRNRIANYEQQHGAQPDVVILKNHGIFVAANSPDEIRSLYASVMDALQTAYAAAQVTTSISIPESTDSVETVNTIKSIFGDAAAFVSSSGVFPVAELALTPDHMVYSRAYAYRGKITEAGAAAYEAKHGYTPKLVVTAEGVYGIGNSQKNADLALELAQDGSLVMHLAEAFGGTHYMTDEQMGFIDNWEVEAYRQQQV